MPEPKDPAVEAVKKLVGELNPGNMEYAVTQVRAAYAERESAAEKMADELKAMLWIFDRALPVPSTGRRLCDDANAALEAYRALVPNPAVPHRQEEVGNG